MAAFFAVLAAAQQPPRTTSPHGGIESPCQNCHATSSWRPIRAVPEFNHNTETDYPLRGLHAEVGCTDCHRSMLFFDVGVQCADCHADPHVNQFGKRCEDCHSVQGWAQAIQEIQEHRNRFPLVGAHAAVQCAECHTGAATGVFTGLSTECATCHQQDFTSTRNPDHVRAGFAARCETCHTLDQWQNARFDHDSVSAFSLTGAHAAVGCNECHVGGRFAGTPQDCFGCHVADFNAAVDPDHTAAGFPHDCETCHTASSWSGALFDHSNETGFELTGAHQRATCSGCHANGRFAGTPQDCFECHQPDFRSASNPDHAGSAFSTQCADCHTTGTWSGAQFDHNLADFQLTGAHATVECAQCHIDGRFSGIGAGCIDCHVDDFNSTTNPDHGKAGFPQDCTACHNTSQWQGVEFDHDQTAFPLTGRHAEQSCVSCHQSGQYAGLGADCAACHMAEFRATTEPAHEKAGFPTACETCHDTARWQGAVFDHDTATEFALTGKHQSLTCAQCHVGGQFAGLGSSCSGCHQSDFNQTTSPDHSAAGFSLQCETCHSTAQWTGVQFDHDSQTDFALVGAHRPLECSQCHAGGQFDGLPQACADCHLADYNAADSPDHSGFPVACENCHNEDQWLGAVFDHDTSTSFPLTGKHANATCESCHVNGVFAGTPQACVDCHRSDFNQTTNPDHAAANFPTTCEVCHTTARWTGAQFDHDLTSFPLTGKHTNATCESCHVNGVFTGTPQACVDCHRSDFNQTTNPDHAAAGFPTACETCHNTNRWLGAVFDHDRSTSFPLTGKHRTASCESCHVNGVFAGTPQACVDCHRSDFNQTTNPDHAAANFPTTCETCHSTSQWAGAVFDHDRSTSFPLTGKHRTASCESCHVNGVFAGTPQACVDCHQADFNQTTNPDHAAAGFPADCSLCHSTAAWLGATFNHNQTNFPLTGKHTTVSCGVCHVNGQYAGLGAECRSCHLAEYNQTTSPDHGAAGFPLQCEACHSTSRWLGAVFDHSRTAFPLTGAHASQPGCTDCHVNGQFQGTPTDCYSCHKTEYESVTNPNHLSAGFPTSCDDCHTTTRWLGATFNHAFPIYSGKHRRSVWQVCSTCHVNSSNFAVFSCLNCHEHRQSQTDNDHSEVSGYVYNSINCYSCHPRGED